MPEKIRKSPGANVGLPSFVRNRTANTPSCPPSDTVRRRVLIVEDDPQLAALIARSLGVFDLAPTICGSVQESLSEAGRGDVAIILMDDQLPDGRGSVVFDRLCAMGVSAPCIMFTAFPDVMRAVSLTRGGLFDYLTKPFEMAALIASVERALKHSPPLDRLSGGYGGASRSARRVRELIEQAAASPKVTVLITGETGTGKELVTQLIHEATFRNAANGSPLVSLDCSAVPAELFESELFGAERGAYTGAHQSRVGLVEAAGSGTLFLDEIGEMPLALQAKLLRFLETKEYRRIGSTQVHQFRGRVVGATNRDLPAWVAEGHFRADLYYRLNVFSIPLPPLRERMEDIPVIATELLSTLCIRHERPVPYLRPEDMATLTGMRFTGNVRELRNLLERSLIQTPRDAHWLVLAECDGVFPAPSRDSLTTRASLGSVELPPAIEKAREDSPAGACTVFEAMERETMHRVLMEERYNISSVARRLGMSRQSVLRRLEKWPELRRIEPNGT